MPTTTKTVHYCFNHLTNVPAGVNTIIATPTASFTDLTIYLPETSKVFKSVKTVANTYNMNTAAVSYQNTYWSLGLNGGAKTNRAGAVVTNTGESMTLYSSQDFNSVFTSGFGSNSTSATCQFQCGFNLASASVALPTQSFVTAMTSITYQCESTSATQIKSVFIPLNAPVGDTSTTKPGTAVGDIPALDTYLPEANKVYRDIFIVVEGNENAATTTDAILSMQIDSGISTSFSFEKGLNSDTYYQLFWKVSGSMTTNAAHSFYMWSNTARFNHAQVYMVVTYEYNEASTTSVMNSVLLPMEMNSTIGVSATQYQKVSRDLWIQEPAPITTNRIAYMAFMDQATPQSGLQARIGTGDFVAYTDRASTLCGSNALMIRNDSAYTLARGRNTLEASIYATVTLTSLATNPSGYWMINYTSGKSTSGTSAHNNTVFQLIDPTGTATAATIRQVNNISASILDPYYFFTSIGNSFQAFASNLGGLGLLVERKSTEGGPEWENTYVDVSRSDSEIGTHQSWAQARDIFKRYKDDPSTRINALTPRSFIQSSGTGFYGNLDFLYTYHTITSSIAVNVGGTTGGTVNLEVCRASNNEIILTGSRAGDGAASFVWYDDTEDLYIRAISGSNVAYSTVHNPTGSFGVTFGDAYSITINLT